MRVDTPKSDEEFAIIIDTDSYAGNFEREMCAYITGCTGECEVGKEAAELAHEELPERAWEWFPEHVVQTMDDHGVRRPCSIAPTPGWFNDGVGHHYRENNYDPAKVIEAHNKEVEDYAKNTIEKVYGDKAYGKEQADKHRKEKTIPPGGKIYKYPAYMSVEIVLDAKPPKSILDVVVERAKAFAAKPRDEYVPPFTVEAVRLVKRTTKVTTKTLKKFA